MSKISLKIPNVVDGKQVSFIVPCASEDLSSFTINGDTYDVVDTHHNTVFGVANMWNKGSIVSVIIDTGERAAYLQNAAVPYYVAQCDITNCITLDVQSDADVAITDKKFVYDASKGIVFFSVKVSVQGDTTSIVISSEDVPTPSFPSTGSFVPIYNHGARECSVLVEHIALMKLTTIRVSSSSGEPIKDCVVQGWYFTE